MCHSAEDVKKLPSAFITCREIPEEQHADFGIFLVKVAGWLISGDSGRRSLRASDLPDHVQRKINHLTEHQGKKGHHGPQETS